MRNQSRLLTAALLLVPLLANAAGTIEIENTVAGLDAIVRVSDAPKGDSLLTVLQPSGDTQTAPVHSANGGTLRTSIPGEYLQEAGSYRAYLTDGKSRLTSEASFSVLADSVDPQISQMETDTQTLAADGVTQATITVTLRDQFGNLLSGRPVELVGSRLEDDISPLSTMTDTTGRQRFTITSTKPGTVFLRALDLLSSTTLDARAELSFQERAQTPGGYSSDLSRYMGYSDPWFRAPVPYYPYPAPAYGNPYAAQVAGSQTGVQSFEITTSPRVPQAGQSFTMTIRAVSGDGKTAQDYVGTVQITAPDDADAVLPGLTEEGQGQAKFIPKNLGMKVMPLSTSFSTPGQHTIIAEDTAMGVSGELTVTVAGVEVPDDRKITFTSPADGETVTNPVVTLQGKGPSLRNLTIAGGLEDALGETDESGFFSIVVNLDPTQTSHTLRAEDDSEDLQQRFSGSLSLTLAPPPPDSEAPVINAALSPIEPLEGEDVTLTVTSPDTDLLISFAIGDQQLTLTPESSAPGTYSVLFRAPAAGTYPASLVATDASSNTTVQQLSVSVAARVIPTVQGLTAEPRIGGVNLLWEPLEDANVTSYVVYVGTQPNVFDSTLETAGATEGAAVMGLDAGKTYFFAVTAKTENGESPKSTVIQSGPLGLGLTAASGAGAIQLSWTFPGDAIVVKGFLLEYGVSETDLTEHRELAEKQRVLLVSDLLPTIPYTFRMTPIAESGEPLKDMAVMTTAVPLAVDYLHPSASEGLPFSVDDSTAPDDALHAGAENTTGSGLPLPLVAGSVLAAAITIILWSRRRSAHASERAFLAAAQARYTSR